MKIPLDNCIPRAFERLIPGHEVIHCSRVGWELLANGRLLDAAQSAGFELLVTVDRGIGHQQNMHGRTIALMCLHARRNDVPSLTPLAELILNRLATIAAGTVIAISAENSI